MVTQRTRRSLARRFSLVLLLAAAACEGGAGSPPSDAALSGDGFADARVAPLGLFCSPGADPPGTLITDFSPATFSGNKGQWAGDPNLTFFTYSYTDPASPGSTVSDKVEAGVFTFSGEMASSGSAGTYAGGGMHFDSCVNTTRFGGVEYTLTGSSGGCPIYFDLQTYAQQTLRERGGCASYCYQFPRKTVLPSPSPITVRFSELEGTGIPSTAAAMAAEIMGMRWQVESPSGQTDGGPGQCSFNLRVDDVRFVK